MLLGKHWGRGLTREEGRGGGHVEHKVAAAALHHCESRPPRARTSDCVGTLRRTLHVEALCRISLYKSVPSDGAISELQGVGTDRAAASSVGGGDGGDGGDGSDNDDAAAAEGGGGGGVLGLGGRRNRNTAAHHANSFGGGAVGGGGGAAGGARKTSSAAASKQQQQRKAEQEGLAAALYLFDNFEELNDDVSWRRALDPPPDAEARARLPSRPAGE